jgi:hypothetical protein
MCQVFLSDAPGSSKAASLARASADLKSLSWFENPGFLEGGHSSQHLPNSRVFYNISRH